MRVSHIDCRAFNKYAEKNCCVQLQLLSKNFMHKNVKCGSITAYFKLHIKYLFSCISPHAIINIHLNVILSFSLISSPKFDYIQRNFLFSIRISLFLYHSISHGLSRISLHKKMWFVIWATFITLSRELKRDGNFFLRWNIRSSIEIKYTVLDFICNLKNPTTTFQRIHHVLPRIYCRLK